MPQQPQKSVEKKNALALVKEYELKFFSIFFGFQIQWFLAIIEGARAKFMNLLSRSHHSLGLRHVHHSIDILSPRMPKSLNLNIL